MTCDREHRPSGVSASPRRIASNDAEDRRPGVVVAAGRDAREPLHGDLHDELRAGAHGHVAHLDDHGRLEVDAAASAATSAESCPRITPVVAHREVGRRLARECRVSAPPCATCCAGAATCGPASGAPSAAAPACPHRRAAEVGARRSAMRRARQCTAGSAASAASRSLSRSDAEELVGVEREHRIGACGRERFARRDRHDLRLQVTRRVGALDDERQPFLAQRHQDRHRCIGRPMVDDDAARRAPSGCDARTPR